MTHNLSRIAGRAAAVTAATALALGAVAFTVPADAATSTKVTVTKLSVHRLPSETAKQAVTVTGTGFDEDVIASVSIGGCDTDPTYIVASATSLLLKTADDCAIGTDKVVTVTDDAGNTAVSPSAAGAGITFVAAPTILAGSDSDRPVVTENSSGVDYADQITAAPVKGGTTIRVYSGDTAFVNSTAFPLAASLGGVALTKVTMHTGGDYFTGVVGAHVADASPALKVTSNGVSKSFLYGAGGSSAVDGTHDFTYGGVPIVVAPTNGPINGGTVLSITGSGFTSSTTAEVAGESCPVVGTPTATLFKCTVPAATAAGAADVVTTTGSVSSVVSVGSTFTYVSQ